MGIYGGPYVIKDSSLMLELDAADTNSYVGSGTLWKDVANLNNSGSLINGPTFDSTNQGSIVFNGTNQYVNLFNKAWVASTVSGFTFDAIVKASSITDRYIAQQASGNGLFAFVLGAHGGVTAGTYGFFVKLSNESFYAVSGSTATTTDWVCATGVYTKGSSVSFYENGILKNNLSIPNLNLSTTSPSITTSLGCYNTASPQFYFPGRIAGFRVYNRALTPLEVLQNYNAQKSRFRLT